MRWLAAALFLWGAMAQAQEPRDTLPRAVPLPAADSVRADSVRADSVRADSIPPRDTIKSPIARAPRSSAPEISGRRVIWDRDAIFESGALTLPDLLAQVPGVTTMHAGFIAAVSATSWYGEPGRVRVYLDGVEIDPLDARSGGVADLSVIQIWSLEEVAVERMAGELRVHLRSWRVERTTAQTRTDVTTGSENTNLYRGFFGKRLNNGGVLQVAAQQYSTASVRTRGDGDALAAFARVGVARGRLTVDGVATRMGRTRTATIRNFLSGTIDNDAISEFEGRDLSAYVRAAWGDPGSEGLWLQAVAATVQHHQAMDRPPPAGGDSTDAPPDTSASQAQYVAAAGYRRWGADLSATARMRVGNGGQRFAPALRASWDNRWVGIAAYSELGGPDSTDRLDVAARLTPLPWLHFGASHSVHTPEDAAARGPERSTSRAEAGVRLWGRWVSGGVIQRSASWVGGLPAFDPLLGPVDLAAAQGVEVAVSGPLFGPLSFSFRGVEWDGSAFYRPHVESRAELRVSTALERYLKRGNFRLTASLIHEYRGALEGPGTGTTIQRAEGAGVVSSMLDIRIGTAHVFWYNRNFNGKLYETVPGFLMPRMVQLYGVRWEFWN